MEPLSPARYKVQFTAGAALHDKLERLQALMPGEDLAAIIEQAVTEKLERLETKRFAMTKAPRKEPRKAPSGTDSARVSRHIPAAVRRVVNERDKGQCRYVDRRGRRCPERHRLEYHHRRPYALGGDPSPDNICLLCRAHNQYMARHDYGPKAMSRNRRSEKRAPSVLLWTEGSLVSGPEDS